MLKMHRIVISFLLPVFLLASITGCAPISQGAVGPGNASGKTIHFGYITADQLHSPAVMIMKEKKLLEAEGFNVIWHEYIAGTHAIQDMVSGKIDFASCGVTPIIISRSQGAGPVILAGSNREGSSLIVADDIKSILDLDGKTIATPGPGSIQDAMATLLAMENGITIRHTTIEVTDMPVFLKKGEIDGFIAWAPHPAYAVSQKLGHELLTSGDILPGHQCCVLAAMEDSVKNGRDTVYKVLEVYLDAYVWFLENPEESIEIMVKTTGINEKIIHRAISTVNYTYPPYCNADSIKSMARSLAEAGRIIINTDTPDTFVESIYLPELMDAITAGGRPD